MTPGALSSSFRDPSGFLFETEGTLFRQVNRCYREDFERLIESGLYESLMADGLMVPHEEVAIERADPEAWKVIRPERVPFISYPYEWCFSQLKAAALATLEIQRRALRHGMTLKDGSAYNIQFVGGRPLLIDTLSFEKYSAGAPWVAYRQFCQHFLAPLALMSRRDPRLAQWFRIDIDGIPLDFASSLLPWRTWFSFSLVSHIHLHARSQKRYASHPESKPAGTRTMGRFGLDPLIASLDSGIRALNFEVSRTTWSDYYENTNYATEALEKKRVLVEGFVSRVRPRTVWDLGANTGLFSRSAARFSESVVAFDFDHAAVDRHYREVASTAVGNVLPLVLDLTNPSAGIGFANAERLSLADRGPADLAMALALVHHLAIGDNVPLSSLASYLSRLCRHLIIEFVPKEDSQVRRMLASRTDVFASYDQEEFERAFGKSFDVVSRAPVPGTVRTLYLLSRRARD